MAARPVGKRNVSTRSEQVLLKSLMLAALLGPLAACTTGGPPAPVEGRTPGGVTKSTPLTRSAGASPAAAPATAAGTRVFALPDATGPAAAPVPMDEAIPVPVPLPAERTYEDPALRELIAQVDAGRWPQRDLAGNAIDFHTQILGLSFHQAMKEISGG